MCVHICGSPKLNLNSSLIALHLAHRDRVSQLNPECANLIHTEDPVTPRDHRRAMLLWTRVFAYSSKYVVHLVVLENKCLTM